MWPVLGLAFGFLLASVSFVESESRFCRIISKPNSSNLRFHSLTNTKTEIILIEAEEMYILPMSNLDTNTDTLAMYDEESGSPVQSTLWYRTKWMNVLEYHQNSAGMLRWFTMMLGTDGQLYRYYRMRFTWYLIPNTTTYIDAYNASVLPWAFKTVNDVEHGGGWFVGLVGVGKRTRVMMTKIVVVQNKTDPKSIYVNYPGEMYNNYKPIPPPYPYYFLETNAQRNRVFLRTNSSTSQSNSISDLFVVPQSAILTSSKLYLFSETLRRVYIIPSDQIISVLTGSKPPPEDGIAIQSKSWRAFFKCNPNQVVVGESEEEKEPSQEEYLRIAKELLPTDPPREPINWENVLEVGCWAVVVVLLAGIVGHLLYSEIAEERNSEKKKTMKTKKVGDKGSKKNYQKGATSTKKSTSLTTTTSSTNRNTLKTKVSKTKSSSTGIAQKPKGNSKKAPSSRRPSKKSKSSSNKCNQKKLNQSKVPKLASKVPKQTGSRNK